MLNVKALLTKVLGSIKDLKKDYIVDEGTSGNWFYRKWNSGKAEAWYDYTGGAATYTVWVSPVRYRDMTFTIPSGIFNASPAIIATSKSNQLWVVDVTPTSSTGFNMRFATVASSNVTTTCTLYAIGTWK